MSFVGLSAATTDQPKGLGVAMTVLNRIHFTLYILPTESVVK
jgi:hypothetical protein